MKEKYLPIGTVVLLKEATKTLMITGYCSSTPDEATKVYDYVAGLFPEGTLAGADVALFNHEQIGQILHVGLENEEFKDLNKRIVEVMSEPVSMVDEFAALPSFTPENVNLILAELHKHEDDLKPIAEPTAFDEEVIKKPVFELPSLGGDDKKEEKKIEEPEEEEDIEEEEEEVVQEEKEVTPDGQPVLQLQPIFEGGTSTGDAQGSAPSTPIGGMPGLDRL